MVLRTTFKGIFAMMDSKSFTWDRFVGAGGMPSSHSALVASLALSVLFEKGFDSALFAVSFVFAFIVIYDASGVRYAVGQQAKILNAFNKMAEDQKLFDKELKEYMGHTKLEVAVGCMLGLCVSIVYHFFLIENN